MKYFISIIIFNCFLVLQGHSQLSTDRNFISASNIKKPNVTAQAQIDTLSSVKNRLQQVNYFDGLGRVIQSVTIKGSNGTKDIVVPNEYDNYGREIKRFLPYVDATIAFGSFRNSAVTEQSFYYNISNSASDAPKDINPYSQTFMEFTPYSRVKEIGAQGETWQPGSGHGVKQNYYSNRLTDSVRIWNIVDVVNGLGNYNSASIYAAGELYKAITTDEHGKQVIEFKDKEGKVILKKVQFTAIAETDPAIGSGHYGWLCTYYIYDDLGNLRAVIQPKGVELISSNWLLTDANILAEQVFRYEYDQRNRMIRKKVPGAGEVYMVYDERDRLVMTQDANMRNASAYKWMITKYDALNRPTETGIWLDPTSTTFASHLTNASTNNTEYPSTTSGYELLTKTHYDDYLSLPSGLFATYQNNWDGHFSLTDNVNWPYPQLPSQSNAIRGMATWSQTKILNSSPAQYIFTVMIYDEKGRVIQVQSKNDLTGGLDVITTQYSWAGQPLVSVQRQQIVGTGAQENISVSKLTYDDLGRVVKTEKKVWNSILNAATVATALPYVVTAENTYDALGQLKTKKLGRTKDPSTGNYTATALETMTYDYNIRGWLLGMNRDFIKDQGTSKFGFELAYDKKTSIFDNNVANTYTQAQFNGNIGGMIWKSIGDGQKRKYDFDYDPVNRLTKADFTQYTSGWNTSAGVDYSVGGSAINNNRISYDANGNILEMWQKGLKVVNSDWIDKMSYSYYTNTNKLKAVTDAITTDQKLGDFTDKNITAIDYGYDKNGNMITDLNKQISGTTGTDLTSGGAITYIHLNLPFVITVAGKGTITYTYDATGSKQRKTTVENSVTTKYLGTNYVGTITTITDYINGFVFESKTYSAVPALNYSYKLQFTGHEEGRVRALYMNDASPNTITGLVYDYMIIDHLGNVRMLLTDELQNNIYPVASLEDATVNCESVYYSVNTAKVVNKTTISDPSAVLGYANNNGFSAGPCGTGAGTNAKMYRLFAASNAADTGLSMTLKVMSGDVINIWGKSFYNQTNSSQVNYAATLTQLITGFLGAGAGGATATGHGATLPILNANTGTTTGLTSFINDPGRGGGTLPKAYINWVLFDEQFNFVKGGYSRVDQSVNTLKDHHGQLTDLTMTKNGYLYIYVSNESPVAVFFDNLQVVHTRGPVLEETHYYPFGLTMAGISSKSAGSLENKRKYNGINYENSFDLNIGEAFFRTHDPQIGRWWQIDPKLESEIFISPYAAMNNNPISLIDPLGDIVKKEKEEGVTPKEFRHFKREIRQMRKKSPSFNAMYKNLKRDEKHTYTYIATNGSSGAETRENNTGGYDMRFSMHGKDPNQIDETSSQIASIAHETGHSFRRKNNLEVVPKPLKLDISMSPEQSNTAINNSQRSTVNASNANEIAAGHIQNIVVSELINSDSDYFSSLQLSQSYFGGKKLDIFLGADRLIKERISDNPITLNLLQGNRTKEYYMNTNFNIYTENGLPDPNNK